MICLTGVVMLASIGAAASAEPPADRARRAGLRVFAGQHLVLATDRPERAQDGIERLCTVFDAAFLTWCRHYELDPEVHRTWQAFGCLIVERERFRAAGLLPDDGSVPDFQNGFCLSNRFWMMDQSNHDYRRHLLLHEGVHAFTLTLLTADAPPWYTEGIAEYLATHRLDEAGLFVPMPLPRAASDVEQLGRIERLRSLHAAGTAPSLEQIFALPATAHREIGAYAASWAAVTFLAGHPAFRASLAATERKPLDRDFTARLTAAPGWDGGRAGRDFNAFVADLDYGYDFDRMTVDWSTGEPLAARQTVSVAADRGWQNSGWALKHGQRCEFNSKGLVGVGEAANRRLESSPEGITLRWYGGRPAGRLLVGQWVESPTDGGRPRFIVLAEGAVGTFTAATDGPLYLKVNERPGELADNRGEYVVQVSPAS